MDVTTQRIIGPGFYVFAGGLTLLSLWLARREGWGRLALALWVVGSALNVGWEAVMVLLGWRGDSSWPVAVYRGLTEWGTFAVALIWTGRRLRVVDVRRCPA